ncbi:methyltransferase domain-containing protein [Labrys wisconsinensis]|uniref:SAM-dependent methyltransferase n=1 Tax=Labrys wisconsinensis TaxID=425677 RepID=A0ABU0J2H3_9HYPH|nr:methyltransferase domain-containing protein [Labrys wisconsinensis]MDQ0467519.1 SAM-dependent methyltransferase [Labrys wisconsinensis]
MTAPRLFDRQILVLRRHRAAAAPADFLLRHVALDMADRLSAVLRRFERAVEVGSLSPALAEAAAPFVAELVRLGPAAARPDVVADEEALPLAPASADLALSALALHAVNDLPGALVQIRRALKPDGLFLAALAGGATLTELRQAFAAAESEVEGGVSPHVFPFADVRDMGGLLQRAGFALPVTDSEVLTVRYADAFALMADLRAMGATNILAQRRRAPMRRATLLRMAEVYKERFSDADGRIRATFEIVWLSGWAPHASQQAPLKPGSARMRLADALGTSEIRLGDKAGR